ncbi:hypothetical protein CRENBAI_000985 [Crenichthys baileyi]|uniref:Uncharacterized protein n=1 Tax=Crenichthys baileyi TaxID=28760 RepID=A0AAV9SFW6_9TELE
MKHVSPITALRCGVQRMSVKAVLPGKIASGKAAASFLAVGRLRRQGGGVRGSNWEEKTGIWEYSLSSPSSSTSTTGEAVVSSKEKEKKQPKGLIFDAKGLISRD